MTSLQQAALLQHYYQQNAQSLILPPVVPRQNAQPAKVQSMHPLNADNKARVHDFLGALDPQAQMQLANLPKEQQQVALLRIAEHCRATARSQAQLQTPLPSALANAPLACGAQATIWPSRPIVAATCATPQVLPDTSGRLGPTMPAPISMQMSRGMPLQGFPGMQSLQPFGGVSNRMATPVLLAPSSGDLLAQDDLLDDADALDEAVKYFLND
jgi:hypothetical protein